MGKVKVLNLWASPFGLRVLIALEEKGVKYEYQEENLAPKSDLLLQMNPVHKKIPVLIHNGNPVCESLIILEYIDEAWPASNPFLPATAYERARARFWADFVDKKLYGNGADPIWTCKGEAQEEGKRHFLEDLGFLEGALNELSGGVKPYFGGEQFGFMDIVLFPFAAWFLAYETMGNFKIPLETQFPKLHEWVNACMERESVKKIVPHPDKIAEFAVSVRKIRFPGPE
uniref:glutathione transferase n=1 Tax=Larix kaempferi TaxID=54800 RepID=V5L5W5_9CONI|nr:tau class glutathione S-transferase [Larix kaempferi]